MNTPVATGTEGATRQVDVDAVEAGSAVLVVMGQLRSKEDKDTARGVLGGG